MNNFYFTRETYTEREPGESANDRNDRAIRVAAKWYSQHLSNAKSDGDELRIVLLTNDHGNKQKAEECDLLVYKCKKFLQIFIDFFIFLFAQCHMHSFPYILGEEYIKGLIANPELVDRLALSNDDKVNTCNMDSFYIKIVR